MRLSVLRARPLDTVRVEQVSGTATVWDGEGREYVRQEAVDSFEFPVSGALGVHQVVITDSEGTLLDHQAFRVDCATDLASSDETWEKLFAMLRWNIFKGREFKVVPFRGRPHFLFSDWIRDHSFILRGKKYFFADIKDAIELFGGTQADDGMIYDFLMPKNPQSTNTFRRFSNPEHLAPSDDPGYFFQRVPVEADVEYLYVDALHQTWKATGDTDWMTTWLDTAVRAMDYCRTSDIRWSERFHLLKRGFTIDTWDFQDTDNTRISGGDVMEVLPGRTRFGIFHGDNTGYAASCDSLAEMLDAAGRAEEARMWRDVGRQIRARLDEVSWNGEFFTHHVPEQELPDLGVDHAAQVSLSNALALNRAVRHDQAKAILATYRRIRREKPASSPGEYYAIYPPFERGFSMLKWHYMNGGVFPFVGGEIARGAFEHGEEKYGGQILRDLSRTMSDRDGQLPYYWVGCIEPEPCRAFDIVDIRQAANADFAGETAGGVVGWSGEGAGNDMAAIPTGDHTYHNVPVRVIDPATNGRRGCIVLSADTGDAREAVVAVGKKAASLYIHHAAGRAGGLVGWVTLTYDDGTSHRAFVNTGAQAQNWWGPVDVPYNRVEGWVCRAAWRGSNSKADIGTVLWGVDNPFPDKRIETVTFTHALTRAKWFVLGVTTSDTPKYFEQADACYGWLENWNASLILSALIEGLAGVQNSGLAYDRIRLAPRWPATGTHCARVTTKIEASGAYVAYEYSQDEDRILIELASNGAARRFELLLPEKFETVRECRLNGEPVAFTVQQVEGSRYVVLDVAEIAVSRVEVILARSSSGNSRV